MPLISLAHRSTRVFGAIGLTSSKGKLVNVDDLVICQPNGFPIILLDPLTAIQPPPTMPEVRASAPISLLVLDTCLNRSPPCLALGSGKRLE